VQREVALSASVTLPINQALLATDLPLLDMQLKEHEGKA
jgi:hypothetical protein